ncbi:MAG: type II toxin-antitoxin system VapC family toxin [Kamptonema sp. SIO1D9]|nr:type II toxin-antitoxin system VapC family toxin [Kamptonema sp. SIO1D9]
MSNCVLDASALLAYLRDEPGATTVENVLFDGAYMSIINWAEVLTKVADIGEDPQRFVQQLEDEGLLNNSLEILPFTEEDALTVARLRPLTKSIGLSLGDRACLALGKRLKLPVFTSDRTWISLTFDVTVNLIR